MKIYKLGTRWGAGGRDFFDMIKHQKIALSHKSDCSPKKGSIILITLGFTVNAITILEEDMHPVTDNPEFEDLFDQYSISYDDQTTYARAKWFELDKEQRFLYKTQDGICEVVKPEIHAITRGLIDTFMASEEITNLKDLINYKKQIILQGPPGTGKTRLAKKLARQLINLSTDFMPPKTISDNDIRRVFQNVTAVTSSSGGTSYKISGIEKDRIKSVKTNGTQDETLNKNIINAYEQKLWTKQIDDNPNRRAAAFAKYLYDKHEGLGSLLVDSEQFRLVQFHPSYTYEDFVRGIVAEPNDSNTGISYKAVNRVIAEFASKAAKNLEDSKKTADIINLEVLALKLVNEFQKGLESRLDNDETIWLTPNTAYITRITNDTIRYKGDNWKVDGGVPTSDLVKMYLADVSTLTEIRELDTLTLSAKSNTTYWLKLLALFKQFVRTNKSTFTEEMDVPKIVLKNYVLVIDEINRANLSSVLGELIYALEYRSEEVDSMYAVEGNNKIMLPSNLYIIGTMNTADRSVGHIDYAIRRRFAFVNILPKDLSNSLGSDFKQILFNEVSDLFTTQYLSQEFDAMDVQLGHSYFIQQYGTNETGEIKPHNFNLRLKYEIIPILREYVKDGILNEKAAGKIREIESKYQVS